MGDREENDKAEASITIMTPKSSEKGAFEYIIENEASESTEEQDF